MSVERAERIPSLAPSYSAVTTFNYPLNSPVHAGESVTIRDRFIFTDQKQGNVFGYHDWSVAEGPLYREFFTGVWEPPRNKTLWLVEAGPAPVKTASTGMYRVHLSSSQATRGLQVLYFGIGGGTTYRAEFVADDPSWRGSLPPSRKEGKEGKETAQSQRQRQCKSQRRHRRRHHHSRA